MRGTSRCGAIICASVPAAACTTSLFASHSNIDTDTCSATDLGCIQAHLRVYAPGHGPAIPLTAIRAGTIKPAQSSPGKGVPTVMATPGSASSSLSLAFNGWFACVTIELMFTDPNAAQIGGCFNVRPKRQVPGAFGSSDMVAFDSVPDGQTSGTLRFDLCAENLFDSPQAIADFALDLYPISAVSMGQGALSAALKGAPFAVGTPLSFDAQITGHAAAGGGSAGSSTGSGGSAGSGSGGCPSGDLLVSTLNCSPVGSGGAASYCLSPSEYMSATSQPLPAACAAQGTTGCLETAGGPAYGSLIRPCCPGFTCRVGSQCGDPTAAVGGTCLP